MYYTISGKEYEIRKLVLGQLRQLSELLNDVAIPEEITIGSVVKVLGEKLPTFLGIVLVEKGKKPNDKDLDELIEQIEDEVDIDLAVEMLEDFFAKTPIRSLLDKIGKVVMSGTQEKTE